MPWVWDSRHVPTWKASQSGSFSSDWTSPTSWWVEPRPPDLLSHLASPVNLNNLFSEHLKPERGLLPPHNGGLFSPQGGSLDSQYYTLPVIVCLIIHLSSLMADSLRSVVIIFRPEVRPLNSEGAGLPAQATDTNDKLLLNHKYVLIAAFLVLRRLNCHCVSRRVTE